jgi:hypothetical protein
VPSTAPDGIATLRVVVLSLLKAGTTSEVCETIGLQLGDALSLAVKE